MKRLVVLFLITVLCFSCFSCKKKSEEPVETPPLDTTPSTVDDSSWDLPEDLNYDTEINVLIYDAAISEFCFADATEPDDVDKSLIDRDTYIEELVGVSMNYIPEAGGWEDRDNFANKVYDSVLRDQKAFDLVGSYSMIAPNLALQGILIDLRTTEYNNFDKAWYPQFMVESATVNDKTYFISGDASINMLYRMMGVAFSSVQAQVNGISDDELYQMVYDGTWTLENWFTLCEDLGRELDGDGIWDKNDYYPIVVADEAWLDSFYFATGLELIVENDEGVLEVSGDPLGNDALSVYSMFFDAQNTYHSVCMTKNEKSIVNEKCIFSVTTIEHFRTTYADAKEQYRVLPFPKYAEGTDTAYKTMMGMGHTQFFIPTDVADVNRSAAVLEALGYANYNYVTPTVFEETMKLRYSADSDVANMFDIMRDGRTYDVASLFYLSFSANQYWDAHSMFRNAVLNNTSNWTSNYKNNYATGLVVVTNLLNEFYSK